MSAASPEPLLKTMQVAQALRVSVSTVKRWIDSGSLTATRTVGKHRLVAISEVQRFAGNQGMTFALSPQTSRSNVQSETIDHPACTALIDALTRGNMLQARAIIQGVYDSGIGAPALAEQLIRPVMQTIGHGWESGEIDVYQEHEATLVIAATLIDLNQRFARNQTVQSPLALGGTIEGDPYSLPLHLCELSLREIGWDVRNLGLSLPLASLSKAVKRSSPRLVFLCLNGIKDDDRFLREYRLFQDSLPVINRPEVLLGGRDISSAIRQSLPHARFSERLADLADLAGSLKPKPLTSNWFDSDWDQESP